MTWPWYAVLALVESVILPVDWYIVGDQSARHESSALLCLQQFLDGADLQHLRPVVLLLYPARQIIVLAIASYILPAALYALHCHEATSEHEVKYKRRVQHGSKEGWERQHRVPAAQ